MSTNRRHRRLQGFTLMEVLLVLIILVILAGLAVPIFMGTRDRANRNAARSQVGLVEEVVDRFQFDMSRYPANLEELRQAPSDDQTNSKWAGPYLKKDLNADPWGNPYRYSQPGEHNPESFDFSSDGSDKTQGTEDDIGNWE